MESEGSTTNATSLAPVPRRAQQSRASSVDSRVTQWLDFYTQPSELAKSQSQASPEAPPAAHSPSVYQRPGPNGARSPDLRPAPLRVPSSEGCGGANISPKALGRKDSSSKPLPRLPAPPKSPGTGISARKKGEGERGRNRQPAPSSSNQPTPSPTAEFGDLGFLPLLRFGTPPLTPDSSTGGAARTNLSWDKGKAKKEEGSLPPKPKGDEDAISGETAVKTTQPSVETADSVQHSRQERVWLHTNYRGQAPFLRAWGLDITKPDDRVEGLALLRELMQAEGERKGTEGAQTHV